MIILLVYILQVYLQAIPLYQEKRLVKVSYWAYITITPSWITHLH